MCIASFAGVQLSLLSFYWRIFSVDRKFRIACLAAGGVCLAWAIVSSTMCFFRCTPIKAAYDPFTQGDCLPEIATLVVNSALNSAMDLFIVLLPLSQLHGLSLPLAKKINLIFLFALGSM
jgi:hypothetical protein